MSLDPEFIWVHLNHPCREIDVWDTTQPEEAKIAKNQGYIPLIKLRKLEAVVEAAREFVNNDDEFYSRYEALAKSLEALDKESE